LGLEAQYLHRVLNLFLIFLRTRLGWLRAPPPILLWGVGVQGIFKLVL
jgi:hypothetical protein